MIGGGGANEQGFIGVLARPLKRWCYRVHQPQMGMMMGDPSQKDLTILVISCSPEK